MTTPIAKQAKFPLGQIVATAHAMAALDHTDMQLALHRHVTGDWGDLCTEDRASNEQALLHGSRLLSVYHSTKGVKFYVITEWDRSLTTILLPSDY